MLCPSSYTIAYDGSENIANPVGYVAQLLKYKERDASPSLINASTNYW